MLWFAYGRSAQCDPSLYYPRIPALEEVAKATPGRIIGFGCFPALLNHVCRLGDIRGDDGVEPARLIDLAKIAEAPNSPKNSYALTQWLVPKLGISRSGAVRISPLLDMLNVRYVIFRGNPPPGLKPDFSSPDYWVLTNRRALPRVFVPEHVETVIDDKERLKKLASEDFDPRRVAYVERDIPLPDQCSGTAEIVEEIPTKISVSMNMQTAGLVVLADLWDQGWNAYLNGEKVPILRTNHAIRGVEVPAGKGTIEFRYEPASLARGLLLRGLALLAMIGWGGAIAWNSYRGKRMGRNML
jgi:hypothetical protein